MRLKWAIKDRVWKAFVLVMRNGVFPAISIDKEVIAIGDLGLPNVNFWAQRAPKREKNASYQAAISHPHGKYWGAPVEGRGECAGLHVQVQGLQKNRLYLCRQLCDSSQVPFLPFLPCTWLGWLVSSSFPSFASSPHCPRCGHRPAHTRRKLPNNCRMNIWATVVRTSVV